MARWEELDDGRLAALEARPGQRVRTMRQQQPRRGKSERQTGREVLNLVAAAAQHGGSQFWAE